MLLIIIRNYIFISFCAQFCLQLTDAFETHHVNMTKD